MLNMYLNAPVEESDGYGKRRTTWALARISSRQGPACGIIFLWNTIWEIIGRMPICPYCAEDIKDGAKKCPHCHEWLERGLRTDNDFSSLLSELKQRRLTDGVRESVEKTLRWRYGWMGLSFKPRLISRTLIFIDS